MPRRTVMFLEIDGVQFPYPPDTIDIQAPGFEDHQLPNGNVIIVEDRQGVVINANWEDMNMGVVLEHLMRIRGNWPIHMIRVEDVSFGSYVSLPVYMPRLSINRLIPASECEHTNAAFTVQFRQVIPELLPVFFELRKSGTVTVGDSKDRVEVPFAGKVFSVSGSIETLGTGAGQTRIQVRRDTTDILSTRGDFVVASGTGLMEHQVLNTEELRFIGGAVFYLDVDAIPGGSDSAGVLVRLGMFLHRS
jgi:hypothetical protein